MSAQVAQREVEEYELLTPEGPIQVRGQLLGFSTSEREQHNHDERTLQTASDLSWKCSACRWVEIRIIRDDDDTFAVSTLGRSRVPGETDRSRVIFTDSPHEVIELLTDRRPGRNPRLPFAAARALAQAAQRDDDMHDAYVNRAVI